MDSRNDHGSTSSIENNREVTAASYLRSRFANIVSSIAAVRDGTHYGTAYKQMWTVMKVKKMALDIGIRWMDDGKTQPMVQLEGGLEIRVGDIVLATSGMAPGTFSNARTRYARVLRVHGLVDEDILANPAQKLSYQILGAFLQETPVDVVSTRTAERNAATMSIAKLDTILAGLDSCIT